MSSSLLVWQFGQGELSPCTGGADPPRQGLYWVFCSLGHDALTIQLSGLWLQEPKMEEEEAGAHISLGKGLQSPIPSSPVALHLHICTL